jgi:hypothetical protein
MKRELEERLERLLPVRNVKIGPLRLVSHAFKPVLGIDRDFSYSLSRLLLNRGNPPLSYGRAPLAQDIATLL